MQQPENESIAGSKTDSSNPQKMDDLSGFQLPNSFNSQTLIIPVPGEIRLVVMGKLVCKSVTAKQMLDMGARFIEAGIEQLKDEN